MKKVVLPLLLAVVALYLALLALLWWGQERLLFQPQVLPAGHRFDVAADVHEAWVEVPGARLNALHLRQADARGVVFFLHGNAGNLDSWFTDLQPYRRAGLDLFMLDYRGYGKSSGRITSQRQLEDDVRAAWASIAPRYAGKQRVIYGRSLGSGLAATLAAEVQPELTVLVSPYASMTALARHHCPWVPSALLRYPLATETVLPRINGAVLLVHGERDTLIPAAHSDVLKAAAPRARLVQVADAGHNDIALSAAYREGLEAALQSLPAATASRRQPAK